jgi:uracil phosphoribosyltransferase
MHLIITPEYVRKIEKEFPELIVYSIRFDRGLSSRRALESAIGTYPEEERGLNDKHYIVPGGGGFGELMFNSFI